MSEQNNFILKMPLESGTFDLATGEKLKEEGISRAIEWTPKELFMHAHLTAMGLASMFGTVTADDVYKQLLAEGFNPSLLGNAWGGVFKKGFEFTGKWRKSSRVSSHARMIRVWRLKA